MSRGADALRDQVIEECFDFGSTEFSWMAQAMKENEPTHPAAVRAFGARAVVARAQRGREAVEQSRGG
jgi:hypothetical protein